MANYITKELRLSIDASLKNANSTINEIKKVMSHYTFDNRSNAKFTEAQKTLEKIVKDMQLLQSQSFISDKDLTKLNKMSATISQTTSSINELYKSFQTKGIEQFSRTYIAEMQKIAKQSEQIKQDYFKKTGKNYDKEIAQVDKLSNTLKNYRIEKEKIQSAEHKQSLIQKELEGPTKRLAEEIQMRERLLALQKQAHQQEQEIYSSAAKDYGFKNFAEMESYSKLLKSELPSSLQLSGVQEQMAVLKQIEGQIKIINEGTSTKEEKETRILQILKEQQIATDDANYEKALLQLSEKIAQNKKETLQYEKAITAERRKQREIVDVVKTTKATVQNKVGAVYASSGLSVSPNTIEKQLQTATLNIKGLEAETSDDNLQQIINNVGNMIKQELEDIESKIANASEELSNLEEVSNQLTQLENLSTDVDLRRETEKSAQKVDSQTAQLQQSEKQQTEEINAFTKEHGGSFNNLKNLESEALGASLYKSLQDTLLTEDLDVTKNPEAAQAYNSAIKDIMSTYEQMLVTKPENTQDMSALHKQLYQRIEDAIKAYEDYNDTLVELNYNTEEVIAKANKATYNNLMFEVPKEIERGKQVKINYDIEQEKKRIEEAQSKLQNENISQPPPLTVPPIPDINFTQLSEGARSLEKDIESATVRTKFLGDAWLDVGNRLSYVLSLNFVFEKFVQIISQAAQATKSMDKDLTQIGLVLGKTSKQVWRSFDTYAKSAARLNTTVADLTSGMKLFYQQGLNTNDVNKMVEASAIAAALGETTLADAAETLTSVINSYNLTAREAMEVTDKISQIAIVSAADFGEISTAIEKVASSAASAGLDLDHMVGYLAKMIETTREAPTNIGTALKTIVANFTQFRDDPSGLSDSGSAINKVDTALRSVGISLTDTNGEVRDLSEVLDELGSKWDSLNRNQKSYLATSIAGTRQQSRFYALMNDYGRTLELVEEGSNSAGKSYQQFALYSNSLEASTQRLENQMQIFFNQLSAGGGVLSTINNLLTGLMTIINKIGAIPAGAGLVTLIASMRGIANDSSRVIKVFQQFSNIDKTYFNKRLALSQDSVKPLPPGSHVNDHLKQIDDRKTLQQRKDQLDDYRTELLNKEGGPQLEFDKLSKNDQQFINSLRQINEHTNKTIENIVEQNKSLSKLRIGWAKFSGTAKTAGQTLVYGAKAFGTAMASVAKATIIMFAIQLAFKGLALLADKLSTSLGINTTRFIENAEKAQNNASSIQSLLDEYTLLASKVNKSAKEQERLNEIIDEAAKVDSELGAQLRANANDYETIIKLMDQYIDKQQQLQLLEENKAYRSESGVWAYAKQFFGDIIGSITGDSDRELNIAQSNARVRGYAANSAKTNNLNDVETEMLNKYVESRIIRYNGLTNDIGTLSGSSTTLYSGNMLDEIDDYILKLQSLNDKSFQEYNNYMDKYTSKDTTVRGVIGAYNNLQSSEVKELVGQDIQEVIKSLDFNISQLDATDMEKALMRTTALDYLSVGSASLLMGERQNLTGEEQERYDASLKEFLLDPYYMNQYQKAQEKGTAGLIQFKREMMQSGKFSLEFVDALSTVTRIVSAEAFQQALENINKIGNLNLSEMQQGNISQQDIIKELQNGTITVDQLEFSGTGIISLNQDALIHEMTEQWKIIEDGIMQQVENMYSDADTFKPTENKSFQIYDSVLKDLQLGQTYQQVFADINNPNSLINQAINDAAKVNVSKKQTKAFTEEYKADTLGKDPESILKETATKREERVKELTQELQDEHVNLLHLQNAYAQTTDKATKKLLEDQIDRSATYINLMNEDLTKLLETDEVAIEVENLSATELQDTIDSVTQAQLNAANELNKAYQEIVKQVDDYADKIKEILYLLKENLTYSKESAAFFNQLNLQQNLFSEVDTLQAAYQNNAKGKKGWQEMLEIVSANPKMAQYLETENGALKWNTELIKENARKHIEASNAAIDAEIQRLEGVLVSVKGQTQGYQQWGDDVLIEVADVIGGSDLLNDTEADNISTELENLGLSEAGWINWSDSVCKAIKAAGEQYDMFMDNILTGGLAADNYAAGFVMPAQVTSQNVQYSKALTGSEAREYIDETFKDINKNDQYQVTQQDIIDNIEEQIKKLKGLKGYNQYVLDNLDSYLSGTLFGDGSEFEQVIHALDKFYNYLRQIQAIENKIANLQAKQEQIDLTNNYHISYLEEENKLLKEKYAILTKMLPEQQTYLAALRQQLTADYGNWISFDQEGTPILSQTEFVSNSEDEEKKYEKFTELREEYEKELQDHQERITERITIQNNLVENLNRKYEKLNQQLDDEKTVLNEIVELEQHRQELSFRDIFSLRYYESILDNLQNAYDIQQNSFKQAVNNVRFLDNELRQLDISKWVQFDELTQQWQYSAQYTIDLLNEDTALMAQVANIQSLLSEYEKASEYLKTAKLNMQEIESTIKSMVDGVLADYESALQSIVEQNTEILDGYQRSLDVMEQENDLYEGTTKELQKYYNLTIEAAGAAKYAMESYQESAEDAIDSIMDKYSDYVTEINGQYAINEIAAQEDLTTSEIQELNHLIALYETMNDAANESQDQFLDYMDAIKEMEEAKRDAIIKIMQQVRDELQNIDQEELDDLKEKYDEMNRLDSEYYSSLSQKIDDARKKRDRQQTAQGVAQLQNQIAVLERDSSGAYSTELRDLRQQLTESLQTQADQNIDDELERIQREQEERQQDREIQITQMENLISFKEENGMYWDQAYDLWADGRATVESFLADMYARQNLSKEEIAQKIQETNATLDQAWVRYGEVNAQKIGEQISPIAENLRTLKTEALPRIEEAINNNESYIETATETVVRALEHIRSAINQIHIGEDNADTIEQMMNNGKKWEDASEEERKQLNATNKALGNTIGLTYDAPTGLYYDKYGQAAYNGTNKTQYNPKYDIVGMAKASDQMQANGEAWRADMTPAEKNAIHEKNVKLAAPYGWYYDSASGEWYTDSTKKYRVYDKYKDGGYVDYTGIAQVDGTPSKPEAFLNAQQTQLFEQLRDSLAGNRLKTTANEKGQEGDNIIINTLEISVKEIADADSIDKVVKTVKQSIYKDATSNSGITKVTRR